jgi:ribosomal protein S28E/S33
MGVDGKVTHVKCKFCNVKEGKKIISAQVGFFMETC